MRILILCSFFAIACDIEPAQTGDPDRLAEAMHALDGRSANRAIETDLLTCSPIGAFEGQSVHCTPAPEIEDMALTWSLPDEPGVTPGAGTAYDFAMPAVCDVAYRFVQVRVEARDTAGTLITSDSIDLVAVNAGP